MLSVKHYDVRISNENEAISQTIYNTTSFLFEHSEYHLNFTLIINITIIDIKGQRSNSTVITKTIDKTINKTIDIISSKYIAIMLMSVTTHDKVL